MRICRIYLLTNKINGKVYIGQTWLSLKERAGKEGHHYKECIYLYNAIEKYGWSNFEYKILAIEFSQTNANDTEDFFIEEYNSRNTNLGYNIRGGGSTGRLSEETKQKLSILNSGENNYFFGKTHSEEAKQAISENTKNNHENGLYANKNEKQKKFTDDEEKEIISLYVQGNISIQELMNKFDFSYSVFDKIRKKFSIKTILQPKSEEHIDKLRINTKIAKQFAIKKAAEKTAQLTEKIIELREQGLLQKDIAQILNISQVTVSHLLIKAGLRSQDIIIRKNKSS
jgi:group I intron endonuclease